MTASCPAFTGRVAVVTGSNKGVGYFIALQLGLSGLFQHVLLGCRDASRADMAVQRLRDQFSSSVAVSAFPLTLGDSASHGQFASHVRETFGKCDVLVNNAAFAYKGSDPTPFEKQCKPTLDVNFRATVDFTEQMLPLLRLAGADARLVNVASMSGHLKNLSAEKQAAVSADTLTFPELRELVNDFETRVTAGDGSHKTVAGWGNSNYGMSKLSVIAATKIWARQESFSVNCCCPGYCKTDMSSQRGERDPADGAKNAVLPATMENPPTGDFFADYQVAKW
jgi:carbonyl reductase 1